MKTVLLTPDRLGEVAALEAKVFHAPWSEQALALLCTDTAFGVVCLEDGGVAAYGGMLTVLDEGQITNVATDPALRRRGCGAAVVEALLDEARRRGLTQVTLEVRESNAAAIALYARFGFVTVGKRPRFYTHPVETAWVMQKMLSAAD